MLANSQGKPGRLGEAGQKNKAGRQAPSLRSERGRIRSPSNRADEPTELEGAPCQRRLSWAAVPASIDGCPATGIPSPPFRASFCLFVCYLSQLAVFRRFPPPSRDRKRSLSNGCFNSARRSWHYAIAPPFPPP